MWVILLKCLIASKIQFLCGAFVLTPHYWVVMSSRQPIYLITMDCLDDHYDNGGYDGDYDGIMTL